MANPFDAGAMAAGYADSRPPVHERILERAAAALGGTRRQRALDIGCGSGISTRALAPYAHHSFGIDPAESMLRYAGSVARGASFAAGRAETLPIDTASIDLATAAGSLNYANLDLFFPEAVRILRAGGALLVYDFAAGSAFRDDSTLSDWFQRFRSRYPNPAGEARKLDPAILAAIGAGFRVAAHESLETGVWLEPEFYVRYMLTETNVAAAVRSGVPREEIRAWCEETLGPVWQGRRREVLFRGYYCVMTPV